MSYSMISTLMIGSLRSPPPYPATPDFPLCRGQNKTLRDNLLKNPPLEMTMLASSIQSFQKGTNPIPVISTVAKRSGEISPSDGTGGIEAGDLSTQRIMGAFSSAPHIAKPLRSR